MYHCAVYIAKSLDFMQVSELIWSCEVRKMERKIERVQFPAKMPTLKNVAAYARVSSGKDAMLHSLSAQVSYYKELISKQNG